MKKLIVPCALALTTLLLVAAVVGCQQQPQPTATPSLAIMVESNVAEAGSSFMVSGSNFKPHQKVRVDFEYRASDRVEGVAAYGEADENGSVHPMIPIPEDIVPGDYEVEIFIARNVFDWELIATLPIRVQAEAK